MSTRTVKKRTAWIAAAATLLAVAAMAFTALLCGGVTRAAADEPFTVNAEMVEGGSLRLGNVEGDGHTGLRFAMKMSESEYTALTTNSAYSDVEFGMIILPADYKKENDVTYDNVFGTDAKYDWATWEEADGTYKWVYTGQDGAGGSKKRIMNFTSDSMKTENGERVYSASIIDIKDGTNERNDNADLKNNLAREFCGVGYVKVTEGGTDKYAFVTENSVAVSAAYVAQKALADDESGLDQTDKEWMQTNYLDKVPVEANTTTYTVKRYFKQPSGGYAPKPEVQDAVVSGQTVGNSVTLDLSSYQQTGYKINEEKTGTLTGTVLYNGKLTFELYYDPGYIDNTIKLVDLDTAAAAGTLNLIDLVENGDAKTFLQGEGDFKYELVPARMEIVDKTPEQTKDKTFERVPTAIEGGANITASGSTVSVSGLGTGLYIMNVYQGEDTEPVYTRNALDIYRASDGPELFEFTGEEFADNFVSGNQEGTWAGSMKVSTASADEIASLGGFISYDGNAIKVVGERAVMYTRTAVKPFKHSEEYYEEFNDYTISYKMVIASITGNSAAGYAGDGLDFAYSAAPSVKVKEGDNEHVIERNFEDFMTAFLVDKSTQTTSPSYGTYKYVGLPKLATLYDGQTTGTNCTFYYGDFEIKSSTAIDDEEVCLIDSKGNSSPAVSSLIGSSYSSSLTGREDVTYTLTKGGEIINATGDTFDITGKSGLYTLRARVNDFVTLYTRTIDIYNSDNEMELFEYSGADFAKNFGPGPVNQDADVRMRITTATTEEKQALAGGNMFEGDTIKVIGKQTLNFTRTAVLGLKHSSGYYALDKFQNYKVSYKFHIAKVPADNNNAKFEWEDISFTYASSKNTNMNSSNPTFTVNITVAEFLGLTVAAGGTHEGKPMLMYTWHDVNTGSWSNNVDIVEFYYGDFTVSPPSD